MSKPPESISSSDEFQGGGDGLLERFPAASTLPAQESLQFGESLFKGRKVRRGSRQKQQATATSFDGLLDTRREVNREIIQDHDLPRTQAGSQELLDVDLKGGAISRSIQHQCWSHARERQGGNHSHDGSIIAGYLANCALSSWGIGIQGGHGNGRTGLVYKDEILARQVSGLGGVAPLSRSGRTWKLIR